MFFGTFKNGKRTKKVVKTYTYGKLKEYAKFDYIG